MPADAFGGADGRTVEILMRRLSAPLPSRWLSIALRRLLVAPIDTPRGLDGADFAAERAWLLLRMGESVAARAVAEGVDTDNVTPKLRQVWMQAALANADPAGLCALAPGAGASERGWVVARAMCATLSGAGDGPALLRDVRRRRIASGIDLQLAQKVMGAGLNSRQAITTDWAPVVQLNAWRFGLATATGVAVPDELYATVGAQVTGWRALAPAIPLAERAAPAETAAAMGVLSNVALVDLYSAIAEDGDAPAALGGTAETLREAYVGDRAGRLTALRSLWDGASTRAGRHARLVLTARAAAGIVPATETPEADRLVAAMLTAGLDRTAARWRGFVGTGRRCLPCRTPTVPAGRRRSTSTRPQARIRSARSSSISLGSPGSEDFRQRRSRRRRRRSTCASASPTPGRERSTARRATGRSAPCCSSPRSGCRRGTGPACRPSTSTASSPRCARSACPERPA
jgi:hypothetical protein